ncbi:SDR family oxidoreductase [Devosia sp. 2618]|uniref:SDR family oxidoreductase n=1 Tax=Devosia sp. 2618 TaxID=3156454 RepID=UPI003397B925
MAEMRPRPPRKNPLLRTAQPLALPSQRSRATYGLTRAAAQGEFALHQCAECGQYTYPPRDGCPNCLSDKLTVSAAPSGGKVLSLTTIHITGEPHFRRMPPVHQALVTLDCGPTVIAMARPDCAAEQRVQLSLQLDKAGQPVVYARPEGGSPDSQSDPHWRDLVADPVNRRVLITDGRNPVALPLAKAFLSAGAAKVIIGISEQWKPLAERAAFEALDGVSLVALDLADDQSVSNAAADFAAKTDILVHTAMHLRPGNLFAGSELLKARDAMEVSYFGALRLARYFGPVMKSRGADGENSAAAWVNLMSIHAHLSWPGFAAYSATQAASLSFSQALRGEMRSGGIRVVDVFTGPMEIDWMEHLPPPKVPPASVAAEIVAALKAGQEERWVGDVAKDFRDRFQANAKEIERDLWGQ